MYCHCLTSEKSLKYNISWKWTTFKGRHSEGLEKTQKLCSVVKRTTGGRAQKGPVRHKTPARTEDMSCCPLLRDQSRKDIKLVSTMWIAHRTHGKSRVQQDNRLQYLAQKFIFHNDDKLPLTRILISIIKVNYFLRTSFCRTSVCWNQRKTMETEYGQEFEAISTCK